MVTKKQKAISHEMDKSNHIEEVEEKAVQDTTLTQPLEKKTRDPKILARLLEIEAAIINKARAQGII